MSMALLSITLTVAPIPVTPESKLPAFSSHFDSASAGETGLRCDDARGDQKTGLETHVDRQITNTALGGVHVSLCV